MLQSALVLAFLIVAAVVLAALAFGGPDERRAGALVGAGAVIASLAGLAAGRPDPVAPLAVIDLALFAGLMAIGWRSRRGWPLTAAASRAMALAVHAIRLISPGMPAHTYLVALAVPTVGLLAVLAAGTLTAWRLRKEDFHPGR